MRKDILLLLSAFLFIGVVSCEKEGDLDRSETTDMAAESTAFGTDTELFHQTGEAEESEQSTAADTVSEEGTAIETETDTEEKEQYIFEGKYSNMPQVEGFTDRLSEEQKVYRAMLSETERKAYDILLPYALTLTDCAIDGEDIEKNGLTEPGLFAAANAICRDYPETRIYWSLAYRNLGAPTMRPDGSFDMTFHSVGSQFGSVDGDYDREDTISRINRLTEKADELLSHMPDGLSVKEKYLWLANSLCNITSKPASSEIDKGSYADGPLLHGIGVGQGYAHAYQLLCQKVGLWCITCNGGDHFWNVVKSEDGSTYYMDLAWQDDASKNEDYYFMSYSKCISTGHTLNEGEWIADGED